jgi:hypothetical protein
VFGYAGIALYEAIAPGISKRGSFVGVLSGLPLREQILEAPSPKSLVLAVMAPPPAAVPQARNLPLLRRRASR